MDKETQTWQELTPEEQRLLQRQYGKNNILRIESLSEEEIGFFRSNSLLSTGFLVQTLYKLEGQFTPASFDAAVNKTIANEEILRSNYPIISSERKKVVLARRDESLNIVYRDLRDTPDTEFDDIFSRLMEANMRQEIDLAQGSLLHLAVFRTAETEYAVLVTMPRLLMNVFRPQNIFCHALNIAPRSEPVASGQIQPAPPPNFPPPPTLPFGKVSRDPFRQKVYRALIPPSTYRLLEERTAGDSNELIAALSLAWGDLLLAEEANKNEVGYPLILLKSTTNKEDFPLGCLFVHLRGSELSWDELAREQVKAIKTLQQEGGIAPDAECLPPFNHFLSFADLEEFSPYYAKVTAMPTGNIVRRNSWDSAGLSLGLYFRRIAGTISISFRYDENRFKPYGAELLAKRYLNSLWTILTDWRQPLKKTTTAKEEFIPPSPKAEVGDKPTRLKKAIASLEMFGGISLPTMDRLASQADFKVLLEGDRLGEEDMTGKAFFLLSGRIARSLDPGDGWYYFLDMMKEGAWPNELALLDNRKNKLALEVISEEARFLVLSLDNVRWAINEEATLAKWLMKRLLRLVEQYQRRWVQT